MAPDDLPRTPAVKRSDGELHFHYNREEREAERTAVWEPPGGGFFRRNRALSIVLIDVIIVVLLFFIYLFFLRPLEGQARFDQYTVRAQSFVVGDQVLVTVTVSHRGGRPEAPTTQPLVTVASGEQSVSDLAPLPDRERTIPLYVPMPPAHAAGTVPVEVRIGDETAVINLSVKTD